MSKPRNKKSLQAKSKKTTSVKAKILHKKPAAKKSKTVKQKKLTVKEMLTLVHNQAVSNQQNLRSLEHFSRQSSDHFRSQRGGGKMNTFRTMHHSRGK